VEREEESPITIERPVTFAIVLAKAAAARGLPPFSSVGKLPTKYRDSNQGAR